MLYKVIIAFESKDKTYTVTIQMNDIALQHS